MCSLEPSDPPSRDLNNMVIRYEVESEACRDSPPLVATGSADPHQTTHFEIDSECLEHLNMRIGRWNIVFRQLVTFPAQISATPFTGVYSENDYGLFIIENEMAFATMSLHECKNERVDLIDETQRVVATIQVRSCYHTLYPNTYTYTRLQSRKAKFNPMKSMFSCSPDDHNHPFRSQYQSMRRQQWITDKT